MGKNYPVLVVLAGYRFTGQLLELERVSEGPDSRVLPGAEEVVTPLKWKKWKEELSEHPDKVWVEFLVRGIREGFRLGCDQRKTGLVRRGGTMYEATQHRKIIGDYLEKEVAERRVWKINETSQVDGIQVSPFGVIPKKDKPGRWRLIVNLSAPEGASVNDGIAKELARVAYTSVDEVVTRVLELGKGTMIAKADVKAAYRNVPVHPKDRWLLGMEWNGETYVDGTLPFGLRSAPLLFTALGDAIEWVASREGGWWIRHYIDDFVTVGRTDTDDCARAMGALKATCSELGMPLDEAKEEGPSEVLTFLGIEIDTVNMEVRLPQAKVNELMGTLERWRGMKSCRRRDLESIVGSLNHACKAVRPGRAFKRRLQDLLTSVKRDNRRVRLNAEARADLEWWWQFGLQWNGTAFMTSLEVAGEPQATMVSDASGRWGCGASWQKKWFQLSWKEAKGAADWSIMPKELLPIVAAALLWKEHWRGKVVRVRCDNMAVVLTIKSGSCKEKAAMHLMRCLAFVEATVPMTVVADHIRGVDNTIADALSRDKLDVARSLMQGAEEESERVPEELVGLLTTEDRSWTEREWGKLRRFCSIKA